MRRVEDSDPIPFYPPLSCQFRAGQELQYIRLVLLSQPVTGLRPSILDVVRQFCRDKWYLIVLLAPAAASFTPAQVASGHLMFRTTASMMQSWSVSCF